MKTKTVKKILLGILIGVLSLILILAGTGLLVYQFYIKPKFEEQLEQIFASDITTPEPDFSANILLDELEKIIMEEDIEGYLNEENPNKASELIDMIEDSKRRIREQKEAEKKRAEEQAKNPAPEETPKPQAPDYSSQIPAQYRSKYEQVKDQINPKDIRDALSLAGKVDPWYLLNKLGGGITNEEKKEMKDYLKSRLSPSEISRGIELFSKYSYLL